MKWSTWDIFKISVNPFSFITFDKIYNISVFNHSYAFFQFNNGNLETLKTKENFGNITSYYNCTINYLDEINEEDFIKLACEDTNVDYTMLKSYIEK